MGDYKVFITIQVDRDMKAEIVRAAKRQDRTVSSYLRSLHIANMEGKAGQERGRVD